MATSTTTREQKKRTDLPTGAARIGVDNHGQTHYLHGGPTVEELAVYVDDGGSVEGYSIDDMPTGDHADRVQAWRAYVAAEIGDWQSWTYAPTGGIASALSALGGGC